MTLTLVGIIDVPAAWDNYVQTPVAWLIPALSILFLVLTRVSLRRARAGQAFLFSALSIASLIGVVGAANFPYLLRARPAAEHGLTIYMASASKNTLTAMLVIAIIGVPLVIVYTAYVYRVFRGKARVEDGGY